MLSRSFAPMLTLARDIRGTVSLMFGLLAVILFGFIGAGVDYVRWSDARAATAQALDAATLAAGRNIQTEPNDLPKALALAQTYYNAHIAKRIPVANAHVKFEVVDNGAAVRGIASGYVDAPFMGLFNARKLNVSVTTKATLAVGGGAGGSDMEISMMLDVTGSMCSNPNTACTTSPKIDALKSASSDLVNILMRDDDSKGTARIALVPFSSRVRLGVEDDSSGRNMMKAATGLDDKWKGWVKGNNKEVELKIAPCVTERTGPEEFTDAAPGSNAWSNGNGGTRFPLSLDSSDTPLTVGTGKSKLDPAIQSNYDSDSACGQIGESNVVMPLTGKKSDLLARIDALEAHGSTAGALGTAWAWYMLSPNWSHVVKGGKPAGSYADLVPVGNAAPKLRKIAVLMTDGQYNTLRAKNEDADDVSTRAKTLCTNMKAKGIEVYTVGFSLDELSSGDRERATDVLLSCATDAQHFYDAESPDDLNGAFRDIAMKLSSLFLSQ